MLVTNSLSKSPELTLSSWVLGLRWSFKNKCTCTLTDEERFNGRLSASVLAEVKYRLSLAMLTFLMSHVWYQTILNGIRPIQISVSYAYAWWCNTFKMTQYMKYKRSGCTFDLLRRLISYWHRIYRRHFLGTSCLLVLWLWHHRDSFSETTTHSVDV